MYNTIKYFLYARKSSEGEDRQITSIEDQVSEVSKLAKELNIEIVDVISESKSAKKPGREKFNEMLTRIEKGEAQGILCWKLNRLARNPIDGGRISWMLQQNVIQHIQTYGREYKPTDNVIMMSVEFGMSNQYVKDLSVDVKRGMRKKAERGWYPISCLPIGYIHNTLKNQEATEQIVKDPIRFKIIQELWQLLLTGLYSVSDIKRIADGKQLVNRNGKYYSLNTFHLLFTNEFYCGYFYWFDEQRNKVRYLGKHIPIVNELEFMKVQEILRKKSNPTRKRDYFFPYRGLIACGECNGSVTAENKLQTICTHCKHKFSIKTKTYCPKCKTGLDDMKKPSIIDKTYYHCTKKIKKDCSQGAITEQAIDMFIDNELSQLSIHKEFFDFGLQAIEKVKNEVVADETKTLVPLKKRKTELLMRLDTLIQMRADREITKEQLQQMQLSTQQELDNLLFKVLSIENARENWLRITKEQFDFMLTASKLFKKGDKKVRKQIASKIGSNLRLKEKSLYFIRDIGLLNISKCANAYTIEKSRLEPKIPIVNKGKFNDFDLLFPKLLPHLNAIRTYHTDNLVTALEQER